MHRSTSLTIALCSAMLTLLVSTVTTAQSFDTLVLKNVPKKFMVGKLLSIEKEFLVYLRANLPNGPEFRMLKSNVRWVITSEGDVMEISDSFDPSYKWRDSSQTSLAQAAPEVSPNQQKAIPSQAPEQRKTDQEYYTPPPARTQINPQGQPPQIAFQPAPYGRSSAVSLRDHYFTIGFGLGGHTQRYKNFDDLEATPGVAFHFEMGYMGFVGQNKIIFIHPTIRLAGRSVTQRYNLEVGLPTGSTVLVNVTERQSQTYADASLLLGLVVSDNKSKRTVFYAGPYAGLFLGGSWRGEAVSSTLGTSSASGSLSPGKFDPFSSGTTQYYRPYELGVHVGLRIQASSSFMIGPDFKIGLTNIFPDIQSSVSIVTSSLPEIRSGSIQLVGTITL